MGLCYKCATPWTKDHKCALEVLLAVEAFWDTFDTTTDQVPLATKCASDEQVFLALSKAAILGVPSAHTVHFSRFIQGHPMEILLDSGSSASFVSEAVTAQLSGVRSEPVTTQVQVANCYHLQSTILLRNVNWSVDQCSFQSDFRVLPLRAYDAIIGMDWLEGFSPMQVHWCDKWLLIPYNDQYALLQGSDSFDATKLVMQLCSVSDASSAGLQLEGVPPDIQALIKRFLELFQPPTSKPPNRACNHTIPLVLGA
jgi:hypothetical protein